jgi:ABC-type nickel/cobalt efflux system permease component RcnA
MKKIFSYILGGLAIVAAFCLAFTIIVVLIAKDSDGTHELANRWMPYISIVLVVSIPALVVWAVFRLVRTFFFRNIHKDKFDGVQEKIGESEDKLS